MGRRKLGFSQKIENKLVFKLYDEGKNLSQIAREVCETAFVIRKILQDSGREYAPKRNTIEKFWEGVDIKNPDQCWDWKRSVNSVGYGSYSFKNVPELTHRFAYKLTFGSIPENLLVCHKCDNRKCCNPTHLFLGTRQDNGDDCARKGRVTNAKLTPSDIIKIRELRRQGFMHKDIAPLFGVKTNTICSAVKGTTWKAIED